MADAETFPKLFGLMGKHTRFYPHYEKRHPYVQEMIDKHEQYHHEVDLYDEIGAYTEELKNIAEKLQGLDPNDPGVKALKDLQDEIKSRLGSECP
jgi:hypothetical protein